MSATVIEERNPVHRGDLLEEFYLESAINASIIAQNMVSTAEIPSPSSSPAALRHDAALDDSFDESEVVFYNLAAAENDLDLIPLSSAKAKDVSLRPVAPTESSPSKPVIPTVAKKIELLPSPTISPPLRKAQPSARPVKITKGEGISPVKSIGDGGIEALEDIPLSMLESLGSDIQVSIGLFLTPYNVSRCMCASKALRETFRHDEIWKRLYAVSRFLIRPRLVGVSSPLDLDLPLAKGIKSWLSMLKLRPRVRLDGLYTLTVSYIRSGAPELLGRDVPVGFYLEVTYWRSLRFLPHGELQYVMHVVPPEKVLSWFNGSHKEKTKLEYGTYTVKGNLVSCEIVRIDGYLMTFKFRVDSSGTGGKWNRLILIEHTTRRPGDSIEDACSHLASDPAIYKLTRIPKLGLM